MRRRTNTQSEYGKQLREKQELKKIYGLREKSFRHYIEAAQKMSGKPADNLIVLLERRLDSIIYEAGFAKTRSQAKQFAGHGLFKLNGDRVNIPSLTLKPGDVIIPRKTIELIDKNIIPRVSWITINNKNEATFNKLPNPEESKPPLNLDLVLGFYSR